MRLAGPALNLAPAPPAPAEVHKAVLDDVDVRGYFVWSLLDNFEVRGLVGGASSPPQRAAARPCRAQPPTSIPLPLAPLFSRPAPALPSRFPTPLPPRPRSGAAAPVSQPPPSDQCPTPLPPRPSVGLRLHQEVWAPPRGLCHPRARAQDVRQLVRGGHPQEPPRHGLKARARARGWCQPPGVKFPARRARGLGSSHLGAVPPWAGPPPRRGACGGSQRRACGARQATSCLCRCLRTGLCTMHTRTQPMIQCMPARLH